VVRIDAATGRISGDFVSGVYPHDNQITKDGKRVMNASLGDMNVPLAQRDSVPTATMTTGVAYQITVADTQTLNILQRIRFTKGVRPFHLSPNGKTLYAQQSNEHAVMAFDAATGAERQALQLPVKAGVTAADYDFEAPHHGLAMTEDGKALCIAGRASDYAAIVSAPTLKLVATIPVGDAPGWAELSQDSRICLLANTRSRDLSFVSMKDRAEVLRLPLGRAPKHITIAQVPGDVLVGVQQRGPVRRLETPGALRP
jgi:DNA-binding beta-propeller fold protein YncE